MVRDDETRGAGSGGWPQVQWAGEETAAQPEQPQPEQAEGLVEPDGYVYDVHGYAHPVYGGYVYDDEGNAYPIEQLVSNSPATGEYAPVSEVPVAATPSDPFTYDRYTAVDPSQWGFGAGEAVEGTRADRKRKRGVRSGIALAVCLVLFVAVGWYAYDTILPSLRPPAAEETVAADDFPGPGTGSVEVVIEQGATGASIGRVLAEAGVVKSAAAFTRAYAANPDAVGIQHGTYAMQLEMSGAGAVEWLLDRKNKIELRVTIVEGSTVEGILKTISSKTPIPIEDLEKAAKSPRKLGVPKSAKKQLEGWLFPATYTIEPGDTAKDILEAMVSKTRTELTKLEVPEDEWETVLNKASLVEKEVNKEEYRGKAARAIENRLETGMTLGIDATLAYGLGKSGLDLTTSDLKSDNEYNTRVHPGLPPTPIGSPGLAAIKAVLDPPEGPWLYWVTVDLNTGETLFAETLAEHNENVAKLQKWMAENGESLREGEGGGTDTDG